MTFFSKEGVISYFKRPEITKFHGVPFFASKCLNYPDDGTRTTQYVVVMLPKKYPARSSTFIRIYESDKEGIHIYSIAWEYLNV